jgi:hypothetical protein
MGGSNKRPLRSAQIGIQRLAETRHAAEQCWARIHHGALSHNGVAFERDRLAALQSQRHELMCQLLDAGWLSRGLLLNEADGDD